jgi:hypothetical protein
VDWPLRGGQQSYKQCASSTVFSEIIKKKEITENFDKII